MDWMHDEIYDDEKLQNDAYNRGWDKGLTAGMTIMGFIAVSILLLIGWFAA